MSRTRLRTSWPAGILLLASAIGLLSGLAILPSDMDAAEPGSQCIGCHTDPARLQTLTPPDPPSAEEGEG